MANIVQARTIAVNPETQATGWISELPEPEELPSHIQNKLEPDTRAPTTSLRKTVDRSADTVRPPTASPENPRRPEPSSSNDSDVPHVPAAPRVPLI